MKQLSFDLDFPIDPLTADLWQAGFRTFGEALADLELSTHAQGAELEERLRSLLSELQYPARRNQEAAVQFRRVETRLKEVISANHARNRVRKLSGETLRILAEKSGGVHGPK